MERETFFTNSPFSSSVGSRPNPCLLDLATESLLLLPHKGLSTLWISPVFDWECSAWSKFLRYSPWWSLSLKASLNVSLVLVFSSNACVAQSPRRMRIMKNLFWFSPIFTGHGGNQRDKKCIYYSIRIFSISSTTCVSTVVSNCGWLDNITATCFTTNGDIFYFEIQGHKLSLWSCVLISVTFLSTFISSKLG